MGFLLDLIQHSQIQQQGERTGSLESRVQRLESELAQTRQTLAEALKRLEEKLEHDIDADGKVG
jgi:hypothetical protein